MQSLTQQLLNMFEAPGFRRSKAHPLQNRCPSRQVLSTKQYWWPSPTTHFHRCGNSLDWLAFLDPLCTDIRLGRFTLQFGICDGSFTFWTHNRSRRESISPVSYYMSSHSSARQWHDVVTLDQSWFYLRSNHDLMWTGPREIVPDRERYAINRRNSWRQLYGILAVSML
jgi:hypothetical protein